MNETLCSARKKDKCPNDTSFKYSTSLAVREIQFKTTLRFFSRACWTSYHQLNQQHPLLVWTEDKETLLA